MKYKALCHSCKHKENCNVLKIYQVVVYNCICLEYKPIRQEIPKEK